MEKLKCSANSLRGTEEVGYKTLAENLEALDRICCLPGTLKLSRLDEGQGIEETFRLHKAKWNDSCSLQFNKTNLRRANKRKCLTNMFQNQKPTNSLIRAKNLDIIQQRHASSMESAAGNALRNASFNF